MKGQPVEIITDWPSGKGPRVPTRVAYDNGIRLSSWGFQCQYDWGAGKSHHFCWWHRDSGAKVSAHERLSRRLRLTDFLSNVYEYVKETITAEMSLGTRGWKDMGIEFHFVLPDSFRSPDGPDLQKFKDIVRKSGIGTGGERHCAILGLTETEAAALTVLRQILPEDSPQASAVTLNIEHGHATILALRRHSKESGNVDCFTTETISLPRVDECISDSLKLWINRDYPEFWKDLGMAQLGHMAWTEEFYMLLDMLNGSAPLRDSYRIRFPNLPESFRHTAFNTKDKTLELRG